MPFLGTSLYAQVVTVGTNDNISLSNQSIDTTSTKPTAIIIQSNGKLRLGDSNNATSINLKYGSNTGINVQGSSANLTVDNVQFKAMGTNSIGVKSDGNSNIEIDNSSFIFDATAGSSIGVQGKDNQSLTINATNFEMNGQASMAIVSTGSTDIHIEGGTITMNGTNSRGVSSQPNSTITLARGAKIRMNNASSHGIELFNSSIVIFVGSGIPSPVTDDQFDIITIGKNSNAAMLTGGYLVLSATNLKTLGDNSSGIYAGANSFVLFDGANIITEGKNAKGVVSDGSATIQIINGSVIRTQGIDSHGIAAVTGSKNTAGNYDIYMQNGSIETTGNNAYGVRASTGGKIKIEDVSIRTNGDKAYGLTANTSSTPAGQSYVDAINANVITTGSAATGVLATGGIISLTGTTVVAVDTTKNSYALHSSGDKSLITSTNASGIVIPSQYAITGDLVADKKGTIDLHMSDGSILTGNTNKEKEGTGTASLGTIKLSIDGENSHWQMWKSSNVTDLELGNNAKVSLGDQNTVATTANKVTLSVDNLSGNSTFNLRSDMAPTSLIGDLIEVRASSTGSHKIVFTDNRTGGYTGQEELKVVDFTGPNQSDNNAIFTSAGADVGPYIYGLNQHADGNWYLSDGKSTQKPPLTNTAMNTVNFLNSNYYLGFIANQTLLQRMGKLHHSPEMDGDIWIHSFGGGLDHFKNNRLSDFDMTYWSVQGGIDKRIELNNSAADLFVGLMAGYTKGDINFKVGDGDAKQYHIGAYATYKHPNGFYVDALAKYLRTENDFNTKTINGYHVNGDGDMDGYALGAEIGQRFYREHDTKVGMYIEPQAQLTWTHMRSATISSSNGLHTRLGSYDSMLGRASAVFGYSLVNNKNPVDLYFKTGYLKEFDGKTDYTFNHTFRENYDFDTGWWDNGIGMNVQFYQNKQFYMDANYAAGGAFNSWQFNIGFKQKL